MKGKIGQSLGIAVLAAGMVLSAGCGGQDSGTSGESQRVESTASDAGSDSTAEDNLAESAAVDERDSVSSEDSGDGGYLSDAQVFEMDTIQVDEASGNMTDSQGFACQSAPYEDVKAAYMAPYESSDAQLIFKVFHVASMGLDQGERVLEDNDWEVDYGFENGVLTSIAVRSPALLYNGMADNIDPQIIEGVDPSAFQEAARTRDSILEQLKGAFDQAQLEVGIDETTGEAVLDSSVLFEVDSYELSDEGKAFLDSFCSVYASVLLNDEYSDAVSAVSAAGIMV